MMKTALNTTKVQEGQAINCILKLERYLHTSHICQCSNAGVRKGQRILKVKVPRNRLESPEGGG
jgi:hypothetical protein